MAVDLTVNGKVISYPSEGDEPGWGEGATDFAQEVATVLATVSGDGDITEQSVTLASTSGSITGLIFNTSQVISAKVKYTYTLSTVRESGMLEIYYNPSDTTWYLAREFYGTDNGINLDVNSSGQVTYTRAASTSATFSFETISTLAS